MNSLLSSAAGVYVAPRATSELASRRQRGWSEIIADFCVTLAVLIVLNLLVVAVLLPPLLTHWDRLAYFVIEVWVVWPVGVAVLSVLALCLAARALGSKADLRQVAGTYTALFRALLLPTFVVASLLVVAHVLGVDPLPPIEVVEEVRVGVATRLLGTVGTGVFFALLAVPIFSAGLEVNLARGAICSAVVVLALAIFNRAIDALGGDLHFTETFQPYVGASWLLT